MKTEKELHLEFLRLGANRRKLTNELLILLPEIFNRKIYLKYASTIIEYAGKFGGLSKGVVIKRLRLEKYLSDKPKLKEAIKTEGVHKVALVANIATPETEEAWVDKLKNMSKNAIQELSKEVRSKEMEVRNEYSDTGSLFESLEKRDNLDVNSKEDNLGESNGQRAASITACKAAPLKITIELTDETAFLFLKLKKELVRNGKILSNKEVMNEILKRQVEADFPERTTVGKESDASKNKKVILEDSFCHGKTSKKISRYIPIHIKKMAVSSTHGKCSYPNCGHPAEIFHHRERFAENRNHQSIIHLCKIHHEFAHNGIIANERQNVGQWNLQIEGNNLSQSDVLYRQLRILD